MNWIFITSNSKTPESNISISYPAVFIIYHDLTITPKLVAYDNKHIFSHTVSVSQESEGNLALWFCPKFSHEVAVKMPARAATWSSDKLDKELPQWLPHKLESWYWLFMGVLCSPLRGPPLKAY